MKQIALVAVAIVALAVCGDATANPDRLDRGFTGARDFRSSSDFDLFGRPAQQIALESRLLASDTSALDELGISPVIDGVTLLTQQPDGSTGVYRTRVDGSTGMIRIGSLFGQNLDGAGAAGSDPIGLGFLFGDQLLIDIRPGNIPYDATAIDGDASMSDRFRIEFDSISGNGFGMPRISIRDLPTQVVITDGKSIVMGFEPGLREYREPTDIPLLGDVPLLGRLFVGPVTQTERRELIVHTTPRIVSDTE